MVVVFEDNSIKVKGALQSTIEKCLEEIGYEMVAQTARNTPVDTGQLKNSWDYVTESDKVTIGSPLENAIYNELGTGEYALNGNGRKGGWKYEDAKGNWHFTKGKRPQRTLFNAFANNKAKLIKHAEEVLKAEMK